MATRPGRAEGSPESTPAHLQVSHLVQEIAVDKIRPEQGLGRKRDRSGHRDLQRSIERFGVLTPITVRLADDGTGDFLLIKGQGRTLACRLLGIDSIPAIVVDDAFAEAEKVQQFLVENVARLKMSPVDRALLIHRAREHGEETSAIATRFGVTASTVRRLLAQLDGASPQEVEALRAGEVSLSMQAVIARFVDDSERPAVVDIVSKSTLRAKEAEALFTALGWGALVDLGPEQGYQRLVLLNWACRTLDSLPRGGTNERLNRLASAFPRSFDIHNNTYLAVSP